MQDVSFMEKIKATIEDARRKAKQTCREKIRRTIIYETQRGRAHLLIGLKSANAENLTHDELLELLAELEEEGLQVEDRLQSYVKYCAIFVLLAAALAFFIHPAVFFIAPSTVLICGTWILGDSPKGRWKISW